jgi:hypothetical protein
MIQSKLKWTVVPLVLLTAVLTITTIVSAITIKTTFTSVDGGIMCIVFLSFTCWMLLYHIRVQTQDIFIQGKTLFVRNWLGYGKEKEYNVTKLSGFHSSTLSSRAGNFKALYIMHGKRKIARSSEYYHSNFNEINNWATANLTDLGFISTNAPTEIKDAFTY